MRTQVSLGLLRSTIHPGVGSTPVTNDLHAQSYSCKDLFFILPPADRNYSHNSHATFVICVPALCVLDVFFILNSCVVHFRVTLDSRRRYLLGNASGALFNPNSRDLCGTAFFDPEGAMQGIQLTNRPRGGD